MTEDYCKLASGIILSTIWQEDDHTRLLWVTMLAVKGRDHVVRASIPGLASVANIPIESCREGLRKLMSPDPDSRTKEHEGRRIEEVDGGWLIVNGEKYRNFLSKQERNEYQRKLMAERRSEAKKLAPVSRKLAVLGQAEAEAKADTETKKKKSGAAQVDDESWIQSLCDSKAYEGIDVRREYEKMQQWCIPNRRVPTRRMFVNWLNRVEKPMASAPSKPAEKGVNVW